MKLINKDLEQSNTDHFSNVFSLDGKSNILNENDFGIANGKITCGINYCDVFSISGLWAPPYASSDFFLGVRLFGEKVPASEYSWRPFKCERKGSLDGITVSSSSLLLSNRRTVLLEFSLRNNCSRSGNIPIQISLKGGLEYVHMWDFQRVLGIQATELLVKEKRIVKYNNNRAIVIDTDINELQWHNTSCLWSTEINLAANTAKTFHLVISIGEKNEAAGDCDKVMENPQLAADEAHKAFEQAVSAMFEKLPKFEASDQRLTAFYYRSLVHYITNQWVVPQFELNPCYTTGSIKGGCLASYLWDYSEGWEMHPLFDPDATKEHIKQYLKIDITNCYSFNPMNGAAMGPWYPANQEKIIGLIYYYVLNTGDTAFLNEMAGSRTVLEWILYHAMFCDDLSNPVSLFDYSMDGEHHLELRKGYPYHGVMPDLNGRMYMNYIWASELLKIAGKPYEYLVERAKLLKQLLKEELWSSEDNWYHFKIGGMKMARYTVQMFKLINSPVLDDEELLGLLSHLNEEEFLSAYGLHSISKKDPAFDQIDIDNGGGGCCTVFPPQIAERLYKAGYPDYAEDILKRVLWWGDRTPYWGDSFVANYIDYRSDTPLQCSIGGVAGAQCIIFGMFGVNARLNGDITINPNPPAFSRHIQLKGLKIRGCCINIEVNGDVFSVTIGDEVIQSTVGTPVVYNSEKKKLYA